MKARINVNADAIEKMKLESEDLVEDRLAQLKEMLPEAFSESGIDFDKLRLLLGDEVDGGGSGALCVHMAWQNGCHSPIADSEHGDTSSLRGEEP